jgi:hypothetical protein
VKVLKQRAKRYAELSERASFWSATVVPEVAKDVAKTVSGYANSTATSVSQQWNNDRKAGAVVSAVFEPVGRVFQSAFDVYLAGFMMAGAVVVDVVNLPFKLAAIIDAEKAKLTEEDRVFYDQNKSRVKQVYARLLRVLQYYDPARYEKLKASSQGI